MIINSGVTANISGVTIRNGATNFGGGGIGNFSTLTLTNSTVSGNNSNSGASFGGGGIFNPGTLTLTNSSVSGNSSNAFGGGIDNFGDMTLVNSTVSGNSARHGGGIINDGTLTLTNSTVSGNSTDGSGGGINNGGTVNLFNTTITNNRADADFNLSGIGGGVFNDGGSILIFQNTILAGNFETDCAGTITSNGNNLMWNVSGDCTVNGGGVTFAIPQLGPLQNNGGPTQTHALLSGSPAIDGGNPNGCRNQFGELLLKISLASAEQWTAIEMARPDAILGPLSLVAEPDLRFTLMWTLMGTEERHSGVPGGDVVYPSIL